MNLSQLKENARLGGTSNPRVIGECLSRLVRCRITDLIKEPTALMKIFAAYVREAAENLLLKPEAGEQGQMNIGDNITLDDVVELIARCCGGNFLRPYLKYLKIGEEKFRDYSFPKDVQHSDNLEEQGFEIWKPDAPYDEPDYFTEYKEEQVVYSESFGDLGSCGDLAPTYIEAPAAPLPCTEPRKEPLLTALDYSRTFDVLNDILHSLLYIAI